MHADQLSADEIFAEALRRPQGRERAEYLDEVYGHDAAARERMERLLRAHADSQSFLEAPATDPLATGEHPPAVAEGPGTVIGPYKLLQQIGEGGMGVVFTAEQTEPIQRTVALKIIKPGMDTRQVIARFEAERQALAMMDHPNIARVIDAGTTETGRSYFVMDLVKGIPITDYCDGEHLSVRQRLELFTQVCHAVQHAHQKGIIHRDLKPSNVLVAGGLAPFAESSEQKVPVPLPPNEKPLVKIIDFGVAKATAQRLTERTMFTEYGQLIGTFEYMSPEQARFNQLDIDTRSDVYSLGVLLYELLTGQTPFDRQRLHSSAFDEMLRIIREEEPPKPSTRLSQIARPSWPGSSPGPAPGSSPGPTPAKMAGLCDLASVAANRHTEPARLNKEVRGELDWIVMKALEKDRNHRYETASGFAADIERHLHDEPVEAGPPSTAYRFRKFARRNRTTLAAGALLAISLLVALGGIASGIGWAVRDRAAREEQLALERTARQAKVSGQLELILDEVARLAQAEKWPEALASARRAEPALAAGEAAPDIQEQVRQTLADLELVRRLDEIRAESATVWGSSGSGDTRNRLAVQAEQDYAAAFREAGIDVDTLPVNEAAERITARSRIAAAVLPAMDDWVAVRSIIKEESATRRLIDVLRTADPDLWRQRVRDCLGRKDWRVLENLAKSPDVDRQPAATLSFLCAALRQQAEADHADPGEGSNELGYQGFHLEIDVLRRAQWKHPADFWINHRLGTSLIWIRPPHHVEEGIGYLRAAVALRPESAHAMMNLGSGHRFLRQHDQAIACYRKAIELSPSSRCYHNLGLVLGQKGLHEEASAAFEEAIKLKPDLAAEAYAELSMIHSTRPDPHLRNPRRAAELAAKAVQIEPYVSNHWTALGVARYRKSQWQEARTALDRSLELGTDGTGGPLRWADAIDWFFLAMTYWQLGQQDQARQCYDRAVQSMDKRQTGQADIDQLRRIRAEAEELLKIVDEKPTTKSESK